MAVVEKGVCECDVAAVACAVRAVVRRAVVSGVYVRFVTVVFVCGRSGRQDFTGW